MSPPRLVRRLLGATSSEPLKGTSGGKLSTDPFGRSLAEHRFGKRMRVLAIHDTHAMRQLVAKGLRDLPEIDEVLTASDSETAFTALGQAPVDFVVSDWNLGAWSLSGIEILQQLRSHGWEVPFGFITAEADPEIRQQALGAGAAFVLLKPFSVDGLAGAFGFGPTPPIAETAHARPRAQELRALLSPLCGTSMRVLPSRPTDRYTARYVATYVAPDTREQRAWWIVEVRLAASLAASLTRWPVSTAEQWASTGVLPEALLDNFTEIANVVSRFISEPGHRRMLSDVVSYARGEAADAVQVSVDESDREHYFVEVESYSDGVCTFVSTKE